MRSIDVPIMRVIPIEKGIPGKQVVLSYEKIWELMDTVSYFAVTHCACKMSQKLVNKPCIHGSETEYCLLFGDFGKFFVDTGYAREITKTETTEIVKRAHDSGLIHMTVNTKKEFLAICNCCSCCCMYLRAFLQFQDKLGRTPYAPSTYFSHVEREKCDGCINLAAPVCIGKCPMSAISLSNGKAFVNAGQCIGCGICGYSCPVDGAITLKPKGRKGEEPPDDVAALAMSVIGARQAR